jgi:peptidoglycan/LPS O-acetylase OafA/YrhL
LRSDIERGRFSVLGFYERRLRRIVPALLVLVLAVVAVSPFVFLPADAGRVGDSALASLVFLSNILFMGLAADYFEAGELAVQPLAAHLVAFGRSAVLSFCSRHRLGFPAVGSADAFSASSRP